MIQRLWDKSCLFCYRKTICCFSSISLAFENIKEEEPKQSRNMPEEMVQCLLFLLTWIVWAWCLVFFLVKDVTVPSNFSFQSNDYIFYKIFNFFTIDLLFYISRILNFWFFEQAKKKNVLEATRMSWRCNMHVIMYILNYCLNS